MNKKVSPAAATLGSEIIGNASDAKSAWISRCLCLFSSLQEERLNRAGKLLGALAHTHT